MCAFLSYMLLSPPYGRFDNEKSKSMVTLEIVKREGQSHTWKERRMKKSSSYL